MPITPSFYAIDSLSSNIKVSYCRSSSVTQPLSFSVSLSLSLCLSPSLSRELWECCVVHMVFRRRCREDLFSSSSESAPTGGGGINTSSSLSVSQKLEKGGFYKTAFCSQLESLDTYSSVDGLEQKYWHWSWNLDVNFGSHVSQSWLNRWLQTFLSFIGDILGVLCPSLSSLKGFWSWKVFYLSDMSLPCFGL